MNLGLILRLRVFASSRLCVPQRLDCEKKTSHFPLPTPRPKNTPPAPLKRGVFEGAANRQKDEREETALSKIPNSKIQLYTKNGCELLAVSC